MTEMSGSDEIFDEERPWSRRVVLRGIGVVGATLGAATVLGACSDDEEPSAAETEEPTEPEADDAEDTDDADDAGGGEDGDDTDTDGGGDGGGGAALAQTSEIEVGGGMVFENEEVVVTQPEEGNFLGFSSSCTHQGCPLTEVSDGTINCSTTCGHGSRFNLDGTVANGPAADPLPEVQIEVDGDQIMLA